MSALIFRYFFCLIYIYTKVLIPLLITQYYSFSSSPILCPLSSPLEESSLLSTLLPFASPVAFVFRLFSLAQSLITAVL